MNDRLWAVEVEVMPKRGVNDPQGEAVLGGLALLGFSTTQRVRVGKLIRIELLADDEASAITEAKAMCDKLLANPVIEEYQVSASRAAEMAREVQ